MSLAYISRLMHRDQRETRFFRKVRAEKHFPHLDVEMRTEIHNVRLSRVSDCRLTHHRLHDR